VRDGVCEQYDGFFDLKDVGHIRRDENNMPVEKLHAYDQGYQIIKQADAVMMLFLFPEDFSESTQRASFDYYEKRNSFGSSLSPSISCGVGLRLGMGEHAYGYFRLTALLDVEDLHIDRNTHEGIHAACAGGTTIAAFWGFGGVRVIDGELRLKPTRAAQWSRMEMRLSYRGDPVRVIVDADGAQGTIGGAPIACLPADP
jgi:kojibiose phosphorylase